MNKNISEDFAQNYDKYVVENGWFSPEILLGLCHPYITAGQKLLDIGIGTGLSSIHFKKAGLEITGIDNSDYMLAICRSKQICKELVLHDISDLPLPFEDKSFDIVIANGIFHLTGSLSYIVTEINRLLKENGIFAFTVDILQNKDKMSYKETDIPGLWLLHNKEYDFNLYKHTQSLVLNELSDQQFRVLKSVNFRAFDDKKEQRTVYFDAFVTKK